MALNSVIIRARSNEWLTNPLRQRGKTSPEQQPAGWGQGHGRRRSRNATVRGSPEFPPSLDTPRCKRPKCSPERRPDSMANSKRMRSRDSMLSARDPLSGGRGERSALEGLKCEGVGASISPSGSTAVWRSLFSRKQGRPIQAGRSRIGGYRRVPEGESP